MRFDVEVKGGTAWDSYEIQTSPIFVLDFVRSQGLHNISAHQVNMSRGARDYSFSISEELARKCGHFEEINVGNAVKIKVPRLFLNSFRKPSFKKYGKEEKDLEVYFSWEFDQEGFLKKWEADGFPLSYLEDNKKKETKEDDLDNDSDDDHDDDDDNDEIDDDNDNDDDHDDNDDD